MSVIRKKPEINKIIDDLTDAEKLKLAQEVNNEAPLYTKSLIRKDYYFSELNNNAYEIAGILLEVAPTNTLPGIVIRTNNSNNLREYFIQFAHKQKLIEWRLNTINRTAEVIDEDLDINELRRLVEEVHDHIIASEIDSGSEPANKVLVSDGDGGAEWANAMDTITPETVDDGDAVQLFGFNSQGQLVKDNIPEGITVDQTIIEDSENAVAGGAVYDLKEDVEVLQGEMEEKANVDGNYPTMTVGVADNLSPYDESSGNDQHEPFSFQATGTGNGSQPDFSTGSIALMKEKQGNTVCVNQLVQSPNFSDSSKWNFQNATGSISNNVATWTATQQNGNINSNFSINIIDKHKYLCVCDVKLTTGSTNICLELRDGLTAQHVVYTKNTNTRQLVVGIATAQASYQYGYVRLTDYRPSGWDAISVYSFNLIDLTQWFNGDIPQDLLDHPENFFRYYQGSLAYNVGALVNANGRYIKCIGMNQWDEEWELGYWDTTTGNFANRANGICSKREHDIKVIPNTTYYIKDGVAGVILFYDNDGNYLQQYVERNNGTFTTPENCAFIRFYLATVYGTTYNHDISINLYYEDEARCLTYEPYEELTNNDTGTEVLRSAGSVKDSKSPDGTITRRVGVVDLGTLSWGYDSGYYISSSLTSLIKAPTSGNVVANAIAEKYIIRQDSGQFNEFDMSVGTNGNIFVRDVNQTGTPTGYFIYELATPTTEQGTPYSENLVIDDFGSMSFEGTNGVPQGNLIFYPVDYKAFIDTLYNYTDGTPSNIALKSDLSASESARDTVDTQLLNALGGTLRQCLCVKESLDFLNTNIVDLGSLEWTKHDDSGHYYTFSLGGIAKVGAKSLCSAYQSANGSTSMESGCAGFNSGQNVFYLSNSAFAGYSKEQVKALLKGVLLAYEKASE